MKYVISWPIEPSLPTMPDGTGKDRLTGVSRLYDADGAMNGDLLIETEDETVVDELVAQGISVTVFDDE